MISLVEAKVWTLKVILGAVWISSARIAIKRKKLNSMETDMEYLGNKFDVNRFLENARRKIEHTELYNEMALYHMFLYLRSIGWPHQWDDPKSFHKLFRQVNMFDNDHLSMAMYNLISNSKIVWGSFCDEYCSSTGVNKNDL